MKERLSLTSIIIGHFINSFCSFLCLCFWYMIYDKYSDSFSIFQVVFFFFSFHSMGNGKSKGGTTAHSSSNPARKSVSSPKIPTQAPSTTSPSTNSTTANNVAGSSLSKTQTAPALVGKPENTIPTSNSSITQPAAGNSSSIKNNNPVSTSNSGKPTKKDR